MVAERYRLEEELGRGGMGVVWRAVDTLIERRVALKELRSPAHGSGHEAGTFKERALREARSAGRLNHPAIVAVHDVIAPTDDGTIYIVMEYVEAPTLAEIIDQHGPLPVHRVAAIGLGILDALDVAHSMGVVHRDVKPSNVLVADGDRVKLTDFGIALAAEDTRITRSGVIGTHAYLAPERFDAGPAGPASDLWALGATLFHAVAGRAPFDRGQTTATVRAILFEDPPAPPCPPPLAEAIAGLLTRPVDRRHTSEATRPLLRRAAASPAAPVTDPVGQASWQAHATTLRPRPPTAAPPPSPPPPGPPSWQQPTRPDGPPPGHTTQPGGQPLPHPATSPTPLPSGGYGGRAGPTSPPHGTFGAGPPRRRSTTPWIVGGVLAAAAVAVLAFVVPSMGADGGSDGPEGAAERLLEAAKHEDIAAARAALCEDDIGDGVIVEDLGSVRLTSYTIDGVVEDGDITKVQVSMQRSDPDAGTTSTDVEMPVVQEGGAWKVCYSRLIDDIGSGPPDTAGSAASDSTDPGGAATDDGGGGSEPGDYDPAAAEAFGQEFLDTINSGDEDAAVGLLCPSDRTDQTADIGEAVAGNASLELDPADIEHLDALQSLIAGVVGSVDGEPIQSGQLHASLDPEGTWCVKSFSIHTIGVQPPAGYEPSR